MDSVVLSVVFDGIAEGNNDILKVEKNIKWLDLEAMLKAQYDCEKIAVVRYIDPDGDYVNLNSQEELEEAFKVASNFSNTLHLLIQKVSDGDDPDETDLLISLPCPTDSQKQKDGSEKSPKETSRKVASPFQLLYDKFSGTGNNPPKTKCSSPVDKTVDKATGETIDTCSGDVVGQCNIKPPQRKTKMEKDNRIKEKSSPCPVKLVTTGFPQAPVAVEKATEAHKGLKEVHTAKTQENKGREPEALLNQGYQGARPKQRTTDAESGEMGSDEVAMPYGVFVKFMYQLKCDLRDEIVKDVTRKTVRHVLKGLDGAVLLPGKAEQTTSPTVKSAEKGETTEHESTERTNSYPVYLHEGVTCNHCERTIIGFRYKCCNCANYNLCEGCEAMCGVHNEDHVFLKLRKPCPKLPKSKPLFKASLYKLKQRKSSADEGKKKESADKRPLHASGSSSSLKESEESGRDVKEERKKEKLEEYRSNRLNKKLEKLMKKEAKLQKKIKKREAKEMMKYRQDRYFGAMDQTTEFDMDHAINPYSAQLENVSGMSVICAAPEEFVIKKWTVINTGLLAWNFSIKVKMLQSSCPAADMFVEQEVPLLLSRATGDIILKFYAPKEKGEYISNWRLCRDNGEYFGPNLWCEVHVTSSRETTTPEQIPLLQERQDVFDPQLMNPVCCSLEADTDNNLFDDLQKLTCTKVMQGQVEGQTTLDGTRAQNATDEDKTLTLGMEVGKDTEPPEVKDTFEQMTERSDDDLGSYDMLDMEREIKTDDQLLLLNPAQNESNVLDLDLHVPHNTPVARSPPKSPTGEDSNYWKVPSNTVEALKGEMEQDAQRNIENVQGILNDLKGPNPEAEDDEEDTESIQCLESDDDSSGSEDNDFIIIPLPDCFNMNKPLQKSAMIDHGFSDSDTEDYFYDSQSEKHVVPEGKTLDEILTTSEDLQTPLLAPKNVVKMADKFADEKADDVAGSPENEEEEEQLPSSITIQAAGGSEAGVTFDPDETHVIQLAPAAGAVREGGSHQPSTVKSDTLFGSGSGSEKPFVSPLEKGEEPAEVGGASSSSSQDDRPQGKKEEEGDGGATAGENPPEDNYDYSKNSDLFVNQMMATAVRAANRAASNAYSTAKEVFYTWQARNYHHSSRPENRKANGRTDTDTNTDTDSKTDTDPKTDTGPKTGNQWKPSGSQWQPKPQNWKPPTQKYKPPSSTWKPPKDNWVPPPPQSKPRNANVDSEKFQQLLDMGFCNKELNEELLLKYENHLEDVIQDIVSKDGNDWMQSRH